MYFVSPSLLYIALDGRLKGNVISNLKSYFKSFSSMSKTLDSLVPNCPPDAKQLMRSLLHFNPDKRCNADHGCKSKYCARFANASTEITLIHDVMPPLSDNVQLSAAEYRVKLYEVCLVFSAPSALISSYYLNTSTFPIRLNGGLAAL